ncbi:exocyst complex component exo70 subunit [Infundibulicybe gibba]|nr:exocyst complex component exo70 subunit [Infundibulicybe gibba]
MDDESAEIELLEQNLNKTHQISKRMTTILDNFDTRIAKLEKSILPLYTSTQVLNRRANNIDSVLQKIDEVARGMSIPSIHRKVLLTGHINSPQAGQLDTYKDALARLNATIAFNSSDRASVDTARLVETGAKKLTQLYTKLVAEASSGASAPGAELATISFPPELLSTLRPLVVFLRTMPLPSTHPSHPAAPAIMSTLKDAQKGYADMRGHGAGNDFGKWVELVLNVMDDEYRLLADLSPLGNQASIASSYDALLIPILSLFSSTLTSLITLIKKSLHKYTFLALSAYDSLLSIQPQWDSVLSRRGYGDSKEMKDGMHSLRAVCLRSFPEFLADLKMASMGKGGELSTSLAEFTISTTLYLERLPDVKSAVGSALLTLGDGNWKMGEGVQVGKASKAGDGDESVLIEHYVYDLVTTVVNSLTTLSRTSRRPAYGSIFLLNNVSYFRQHILLQPANNALLNLLSKPTQDLLDSNYRTAKAGYFDTNFSPLMQALVDDPKEKSGKTATKEKFNRFYELLDEVLERHRSSKLLEDDPAGRELIGADIIKLIVASLEKFTQKHREKEFSKNPSKYIKMSPEAVQTQLQNIYK